MAIEMDRLSQAQLMLEGIATHFFTSVGVIQRDAPPVPLGTKPDFTSGDLGNQMKEMAVQLVKASQAFESLINDLPSKDEEADQLKELEELKADHEKVCKELETAVAAAQKRLALVRDALMVISTDRLASN